MPAFLSSPCSLAPLAIAGLEVVGILGCFAVVLVVLRLAVRWAEDVVRADAATADGEDDSPLPSSRG